MHLSSAGFNAAQHDKVSFCCECQPGMVDLPSAANVNQEWLTYRKMSSQLRKKISFHDALRSLAYIFISFYLCSLRVPCLLQTILRPIIPSVNTYDQLHHLQEV